MFSLDAIKFLASEKKISCIFPYSPLPMSDDGGHLPFLLSSKHPPPQRLIPAKFAQIFHWFRILE